MRRRPCGRRGGAPPKRSGFKAAAAGLGTPTLRIHDLRHTYASLARASGADLKTFQAMMGHSSITVTADLYSHLYDDELDRVAKILDSLQLVWPFVAFSASTSQRQSARRPMNSPKTQ
ncbi:tyrosine-type recombinase/integrase [Arthrobacter sp. A5]|uniref:tyrosine-type recombinase/integrase n=1 Tax=Arthrobacter sp. A5 TaxID=576926 RepID=UPI003DA97D21